MTPGTRVRLISDPGRVGIVTEKSRLRGDRLFWQVLFPDGAQYIPEKQLEIVVNNLEDAVDFFQNGKFGRVRDLRGATTHMRLSGRLADLIYSMETTNTDFYPYQFKPVLNILDSPSRGILIADEVGLGKTIEAGLIWTELRSRFDARRLMVLSPAMLREKWKFELQRRFGISAAIADADETLKIFEEYRAGNINEFAIITSMQGLRPGRRWDTAEGKLESRSATRLAQFLLDNAFDEPLLDNAFDEPLLDLLVIDEAHYLRNPESMTARLGRLIRDVADYVVLLSATPIHLKSADLFHLLNLVDKDSFNQLNVFDDILEANAPLLRVRDKILRNNVEPAELVSLIEESKDHPLLKNNRQLQAILDDPPSKVALSNPTTRSILAYRLENINLLGKAISRTRKREVTEWRVVREAVPEIVELSQIEREFYDSVTTLVREYCQKRAAHEGFLLVTPQRQISSSMPAALRAWKEKKKDFDQMYEDFGYDSDSENEEIGPLVQLLMNNTEQFVDLDALWASDSKYNRLVRELKRYLKEHPKEKIVLFAYFRPTLYYLHERLEKDGISSLVLVGGEKVNKYELLEQFKSAKGPNILLASEVASEGIDLQFSRVLINYDLPWNPMKVEQRIGRIDRLGQSSPKITIWNLFYRDTIDERIYDRLYLRLGIFEYALGGLEAILGDEIRKLTIDLLRGTLSKQQEETRISQTEQAVSNLREEEERLESSANNLIAHGDYILNQVKAARELGRWISGDDLLVYIRDFLNIKYPGCEFRQVSPNDLLFEIKLSQDARFDLDRFIQQRRLIGQTRITIPANRSHRYNFKNSVSQSLSNQHENINQFHPLTRFVSDSIQKCIEDFDIVHHPTVSIRLNHKDVPSIKPQDYICYVGRWTVKGVRDIEKAVYYARSVGEDNFLKEDAAEMLVTCAAKYGKDWLSAANELEIAKIVPLVEDCIDAAEQKYVDYISMLDNENNDRADLQEQTLTLHMERQREKLNEVLIMHEIRGNKNMIAPTKGKIEKLETRVSDKLRLITERRQLHHSKKDVCIGLIRVE